jgi:hypothetical protein
MMRETFKKSDLKTGMVVECRNGNRYTVMLDTVMTVDDAKDIIINVENNYGWNDLNDYTDDLRCICNNGNYEEFDIMKVYQPSHCYSFVASSRLNKEYRVKDSMLIWERKEKTDFLDDKDAMADFLTMGKDAFLFTYWGYTEEMYEHTMMLVKEKLGLY